jgi:hypothetical protein
MEKKEWYSVETEINLVNEEYEARKRIERTKGTLGGSRYGKWAYQLKGITPWSKTWIFNTKTLELKQAK